MAQRTGAGFETNINAQFPTNGTGTIGASRIRTHIGTDIKDSFLNITDHLIDEDDMASDSATKVPSQQSVKAYVNIRDAVTASGTDTYTATITPAPAAYVSGKIYAIKFTNANTGAATINLNSLGAKSIKKNGSTDLGSGDISAGQVYLLAYDGTNFQVTSSIGGGGTTLDNGTYTPTATLVTNVTSATPQGHQYMRVGSVVTFSGLITITPTGVGAVEVGLSLPIASSFAQGYQLSGAMYVTETNQALHGGAIIADTVNDRAKLLFYAPSASTRQFVYSATYLIV